MTSALVLIPPPPKYSLSKKLSARSLFGGQFQEAGVRERGKRQRGKKIRMCDEADTVGN